MQVKYILEDNQTAFKPNIYHDEAQFSGMGHLRDRPLDNTAYTSGQIQWSVH